MSESDQILHLTEMLDAANDQFETALADCQSALHELRMSSAYRRARRENPSAWGYARVALCEAALIRAIGTLGGRR